MKVNKRFQEYVDGINFWRKYTKAPLMTFPLSQADVDTLASRIDNELSPENLCCDGELTRAQTQARYNKLMGVKKDLEAYAAKNGLYVPNYYYEF